jgi:ribose transport system ATP-binding protein
VGVLVISSELPEIIGMCDRVLVLAEGRLSGVISASDMTEAAIMRLASNVDRYQQGLHS